jgi:hypothetical protein
MSKQKAKKPINADVERISKAIIDDERDDTVIIFIPSHDKDKKELPDRDQWATNALKLFGQLYGGATAFMALRGIWVDPRTGAEHFDEPILIQSLAKRADVMNEQNLMAVVEFARQMCDEARQMCVAVIFNDTMHYIEI